MLRTLFVILELRGREGRLKSQEMMFSDLHFSEISLVSTRKWAECVHGQKWKPLGQASPCRRLQVTQSGEKQSGCGCAGSEMSSLAARAGRVPRRTWT